MKTIIFKSIPKVWHKEKKGIKNNTLRQIEPDDDRLNILKELKGNLTDNDFIMLQNTGTGDCFKRQIKDITFWEDWVIITWRA